MRDWPQNDLTRFKLTKMEKKRRDDNLLQYLLLLDFFLASGSLLEHFANLLNSRATSNFGTAFATENWSSPFFCCNNDHIYNLLEVAAVRFDTFQIKGNRHKQKKVSDFLSNYTINRLTLWFSELFNTLFCVSFPGDSKKT